MLILEGGDISRTREELTRNTLRLLEQYDYRFFDYQKRTKKVEPHQPRERYRFWLNILAVPAEQLK